MTDAADAPHDIAYWQHKLVGKTLIQGATAQAKSPTEVTEADLPPVRRILPPGAMKTMDYRTERLNVYITDKHQITRVAFG
ncbi:hypothetical protein GGF31_003497 [Allomyces arbusculus]|nr:hypothetical protein GGF31_003497 [Allomyces arbusculus]